MYFKLIDNRSNKIGTTEKRTKMANEGQRSSHFIDIKSCQ